MSLLKRLFGTRTTETTMEDYASWQSRARENITAKGAAQMAEEIANSRASAPDKEAAFDILRAGVHGGDLSLADETRARAAIRLASERAQAERIGTPEAMAEYERYAREERKSSERIARIYERLVGK